MEIWLVGRWTDHEWEVQGVYTTEADAAARCEDGAWFIMPLTLDAHVPTVTTRNPRAYSPTDR